jgi:RNA polymerase sigma-70 factor (ECF subfamily)
MPAQDDLYREAAEEHGAALERLARACEAAPEERRDLLQEIHLALWRSFAAFNGRCSLRTWVYRVAHNAAASHIMRSRRRGQSALVSLEEFGDSLESASNIAPHSIESDQVLFEIYAYIHRLNPIDRQVMLLYLEGMDAASIGEITGISSGHVATKIHRIKRLLTERFRNGGGNDDK